MDSSQKTRTYYSECTLELTELLTNSKKKLKRKRVHDLRVLLHKIESLLEFISYKTPGLRKTDKALGKVRDLDVAIKNAALYELPVKALKKQRKERAKKARKFLKDNQDRIIHELMIANRQFNHRLEINQAIGTMLKKMQSPEDDLHKIRIKLKTLRYLLEGLGSDVTRLKTLQDQLGEIHDLEVLGEIFQMDDRLKKDHAKKVELTKGMLQNTLRTATLHLEKFLLWPAAY